MATNVYMSSTYQDLKEHREAVYRVLRRLPIELRAMEDYVAKDQRPLTRCLKDVANSQVYLGFFAWRYGFIPPKENPGKKSITELEFRAAKKAERLVFLAHEDYPWPPSFVDALFGSARNAAKLRSLRKELSHELTCDFFTTPDNLAALATGAVSMAISSAQSTDFSLPSDLTDVAVIKEFGSTLTPEIVAKITEAIHGSKGARVVEVNLGTGKTWWSTRLFLLAALAEDFTDIETLMFVDAQGKLIGMASPADVRRALKFEDARLQEAYPHGPAVERMKEGGKIEAVVHIAQQFREHWADTEKGAKVWMSGDRLRSMLGDHLVTAQVGLDQTRRTDTATLLAQVIEQKPSLVPVTIKGIPKRVMDRVALARNLASSGLENII